MTSKEAQMSEVECKIEDYLADNPGPNFSSEIADALGLDYMVTLKAVNRLLEQGRIKKAKK